MTIRLSIGSPKDTTFENLPEGHAFRLRGDQGGVLLKTRDTHGAYLEVNCIWLYDPVEFGTGQLDNVGQAQSVEDLGELVVTDE